MLRSRAAGREQRHIGRVGQRGLDLFFRRRSRGERNPECQRFRHVVSTGPPRAEPTVLLVAEENAERLICRLRVVSRQLLVLGLVPNPAWNVTAVGATTAWTGSGTSHLESYASAAKT